MFKNLLASLGIGAARVDTRLEQDRLLPGQSFRAEIVVTGGDVEQTISGLDLALLTRVEVETGDGEHEQNHLLQQWRIAEGFTLAPTQEKVIPFEGVLHPETPITAIDCPYNRTRVWLQTGLAIDLGRDASDRDILHILPTPAMAAFLQAVKECGFRLYRADVEKGYLNGGHFRSQSGCYQELEFQPSGFGQWSVNEVEVSFVPEAERTHVMLELDRKFRRDKLLTLTIDHRRLDVSSLAGWIREAIG